MHREWPSICCTPQLFFPAFRLAAYRTQTLSVLVLLSAYWPAGDLWDPVPDTEWEYVGMQEEVNEVHRVVTYHFVQLIFATARF